MFQKLSKIIEWNLRKFLKNVKPYNAFIVVEFPYGSIREEK